MVELCFPKNRTFWFSILTCFGGKMTSKYWQQNYNFKTFTFTLRFDFWISRRSVTIFRNINAFQDAISPRAIELFQHFFFTFVVMFCLFTLTLNFVKGVSSKRTSKLMDSFRLLLLYFHVILLTHSNASIVLQQCHWRCEYICRFS